jgi:peptide deformylase
VVAARDARGLIADLADTLAAFRDSHGFGRGIAAPQIGALERVIFIRIPGGFTGPLVNPVIEHASADTMELWDDCFSLPGLMVRVARAARIRVSHLDEHGSARTVDAEGALSELLQHEIDHLDGVLAVQRAISPQALCTRDEWERRHREPEAP